MTYLPATTSDFVSNATTSSKENVTGATVPAPASRVIQFQFMGAFTVAATTTGVGFGVDIPTGATLRALHVEVPSSSTTGTDAVTEGETNTDDEIVQPADSASTSGTMFKVTGQVEVGTTAGDIQLRIDTDAAAAATVKKGVTRWYHDCCAA